MTGWLQLYHIVSFLAPVILLTGVIAGIWKWSAGGILRKWIWGYLCIGLTLDLLSRYFGYIAANRNNLIMFPVGGIIDVVFVAGLYGVFVRTALRSYLLVLSALSIINALVSIAFKLQQQGSVARFEMYEKVICDGVIILFALVSMLDMMREAKRIQPLMLRISTIILLCFSMDILTSLLSNFLVNAGLNYVLYFWALRMVLTIALYLILTYTVWQTGKNPKHLQFG